MVCFLLGACRAAAWKFTPIRKQVTIHALFGDLFPPLDVVVDSWQTAREATASARPQERTAYDNTGPRRFGFDTPYIPIEQM